MDFCKCNPKIDTFQTFLIWRTITYIQTLCIYKAKSDKLTFWCRAVTEKYKNQYTL